MRFAHPTAEVATDWIVNEGFTLINAVLDSLSRLSCINPRIEAFLCKDCWCVKNLRHLGYCKVDKVPPPRVFECAVGRAAKGKDGGPSRLPQVDQLVIASLLKRSLSRVRRLLAKTERHGYNIGASILGFRIRCCLSMQLPEVLLQRKHGSLEEQVPCQA